MVDLRNLVDVFFHARPPGLGESMNGCRRLEYVSRPFVRVDQDVSGEVYELGFSEREKEVGIVKPGDLALAAVDGPVVGVDFAAVGRDNDGVRIEQRADHGSMARLHLRQTLDGGKREKQSAYKDSSQISKLIRPAISVYQKHIDNINPALYLGTCAYSELNPR